MKPIATRQRTAELPRGLRNHNPLNLRKGTFLWQGLRPRQTDPEFLQFLSPAWGYRAAFVTLRTYIDRRGADTPRRIVERWAPPADGNDTEAYLQRVTTLSGLHPDDRLSSDDETRLTALVKAMSRVENGRPAEDRHVREGWRLYRG